MNEITTHITTEIAHTDRRGRLEARGNIEAYATALQGHLGSERGDMDKINEEGLEEHIVGGAYIRILDIPEGITIVSELWRKERLWIIISGEVLIKTEEGDKHVVAPYIGKAPFGSKIALYAIKDTKWAAITGVETEDLREIEQEVVTKDYTDFTYPWDMIGDNT